MFSADLNQKIMQKFPGLTEIPLPEKFVRDPLPQLRVQASKLRDVCQVLKNDPELAFDLPIQITAVDFIKEQEFELVYYLYSTKHKHAVVFKTRIPRSAPDVDTVTDIWPGMNFQEREILDLMGITFKGHPDPKRIMMWDGFPGHPLRKDYVHVTDRYDSGLEVGTPGLDAKGIPIKQEPQ